MGGQKRIFSDKEMIVNLEIQSLRLTYKLIFCITVRAQHVMALLTQESGHTRQVSAGKLLRSHHCLTQLLAYKINH